MGHLGRTATSHHRGYSVADHRPPTGEYSRMRASVIYGSLLSILGAGAVFAWNALEPRGSSAGHSEEVIMRKLPDSLAQREFNPVSDIRLVSDNAFTFNTARYGYAEKCAGDVKLTVGPDGYALLLLKNLDCQPVPVTTTTPAPK